MGSGVDDSVGLITDDVIIGEVGQQVTLPNGRTVIVVGIPDSVIGPEPPPPTPPSHRDVYWFSLSDSSMGLAHTTYEDNHILPPDTDSLRYDISLAHTVNCQDYIPS